MKTFADRLARARINSGYKSAQSFAHSLGVEPHAYRKYERGESEPNFETFTRICELLQLTPNELLPHAASRRRKANGDNHSNAS